MSQLLGLACTCKAWKERMPNCICVGWAFDCLLNEKFSTREISWKFFIMIEFLRNVKPTRESVHIDERFSISKVELKVNAEHKNYDQRPRF